MAENEKNEKNKTVTPSSDGGADAVMRTKIAGAVRSVADAIEEPTKLGSVAYTTSMVSVAILAAVGVFLALFGSKSGEQLLGRAYTLLEMMLSGAVGTTKWVQSQRPKIQKILWLYGLWILGTVIMTIVAIWIPWTTPADIILIVLAVMPYVMALVVQVLVGSLLNNRRLSLALSRQFAIVSIVEFFIAAGVLFLPEEMNGFYVVTSLALAGMIVCAYSRLVGTKSNVIFHAMVISTIMMASAALSIHTLDVISQSDTSRGMVAKEFKATVDAWAYQLTNFLRSGYLAEYVVTQEGDLDVNGNLVKLTKGTKVYRDLSAKPDYPDGLPPRYKVTVNGGTNDGMKGFFSSSLLKPAKKPSEPKVVQPAPAPALTPATTVTLSSPPALTPPVSANPLESEITAETGEWEDIAPSSLIPQAGDMLVWGPLDNPKEFRRLEFIVGLNADDVSTPVVFDYPGGGFVGKTGVTKNDSNSPLRFRVTDGEPITFKVKVEPGEYARYLKRKGD